MTRQYSLAQLTALPCNPPQLLRIAHTIGCAAIGIRMLPASPGGTHYPLMHDAALLRETLACQRDTGVKILDLEIIRIGDTFQPRDYTAFMETGAQLGARHILVAGDDMDLSRLTASYAALCEAARPLGLTCDLECMPWTPVCNIGTATHIVHSAAQPNAALLIDALHFARSGSSLDEITALPRHWLNYAQICDGKVPGPMTDEEMIFDARCERLLPGEGGIDLLALFAALPADLPISIEIPSDSRAPVMGYEAWCRQALMAARRCLAP